MATDEKILAGFNRDDITNAQMYLDFLCERNILSSDEYLRKIELHAIIGISGVHEIPTQPWVVPKALDRLKTILSTTGDVHADQVPLDVQSWERAMSNELVHWGQEHIWFSKLDATQLESRPMQRSQLSRLCFIHAPVVLISYIQRFHGQKGAKMINMMEWMRSAFAPELLNRHIFGNSGGDSRDILQTLLGGPSCAFPKA
jgi:hypothetical protein